MKTDLNFRGIILPNCMDRMYAKGFMFCFIETDSLSPPYENWSHLGSVRKSLNGGIAIINNKTGDILGKAKYVNNKYS